MMDRSSLESSPLVFLVDAMILFLVLFILTPIAFFATVCLRPVFGPTSSTADAAKPDMRRGKPEATIRRAA